jgi:6-hydroxynicotinate 3-monooxygenase
MIGRTPAIAIIGVGLGGLTAAAALRRIGVDVTVYEQAEQFARVGAGIHMSPNAMRVNRALGLEGMPRATAFRPGAWTNRERDSGEVHAPTGSRSPTRPPPQAPPP